MFPVFAVSDLRMSTQMGNEGAASGSELPAPQGEKKKAKKKKKKGEDEMKLLRVAGVDLLLGLISERGFCGVVPLRKALCRFPISGKTLCRNSAAAATP